MQDFQVPALKCIGCGETVSSGKISREDVVPKWLQPHLEMPGIQLSHRELKEGRERPVREHSLKKFIFRAVCARCNSGWMSNLECEAKPVLLPLIQGNRLLSSLTSNEKLLLARWTFKTAFMILGVQQTLAVPWELF